MIYASGLQREIYMELMKIHPAGTIRNYGDVQKLLRLPVTENDIFIIFNWGKGARKVQMQLREKSSNQFPDVDFSLFVYDKINQLRTLDTLTKFPLERVFLENDKYQTVRTPRLTNSGKVVVKVGNDHQGMNKFLYIPGKSFQTKEPVIFEEYLDHARSLRVAVIGEKKTVFLIEHQNSDIALEKPHTAWIKNIDPIETVYSYEERYMLSIPNIDDIIEDALHIAKTYNQHFIGCDYVINSHKTGLLEVNDMIGLPDDDRVLQAALTWFKTLTEKYAIN